MEDFSEEYLSSLIQEALEEKGSAAQHPFSPMHIGYAESDLVSLVYDRFSKYLPESELNSLFQEFRSDLVSRKVSLTIKELHAITKNCKKCPKMTQSADLPKWNVKDPEVVIVIESPYIESSAVKFMLDTIKSSGFSSKQLCLTYVNRCLKQSKYESFEISNCASYLHYELQLLNPKVIVPMGSLASTIIFGTEVRIKDYRGNLIWLGYWPIIPTYSPGYAMKSGPVAIQQFQQDLDYVYHYIKT
jgi:uracil-DNA glycosylase family 4